MLAEYRSVGRDRGSRQGQQSLAMLRRQHVVARGLFTRRYCNLDPTSAFRCRPGVKPSYMYHAIERRSKGPLNPEIKGTCKLLRTSHDPSR
jgi:hypothetical protein